MAAAKKHGLVFCTLTSPFVVMKRQQSITRKSVNITAWEHLMISEMLFCYLGMKLRPFEAFHENSYTTQHHLQRSRGWCSSLRCAQ